MSDRLRRYASFDDAMTHFGIPHENRAFIRRFVDGVGIQEYFETTGYVKAVRLVAGPDLHIASGWTDGFSSELEILDVCGDVDRWPSDDRSHIWGVSHPKNRIGMGGTGSGLPERRDYGVCLSCFTHFAANGACACSDE